MSQNIGYFPSPKAQDLLNRVQKFILEEISPREREIFEQHAKLPSRYLFFSFKKLVIFISFFTLMKMDGPSFT